MTMFQVLITRPGQPTYAYKRGLSYREAHTAFCDCVAAHHKGSGPVEHGTADSILYASGMMIAIS